MKIVSDNPELLDAIHDKLKLARINVKKETSTPDGAMADEFTTALELLDMVKDNWERVAFYIGAVRESAEFLKSQIKVELKDGTSVSWKEYEAMSDDEKSDKVHTV